MKYISKHFNALSGTEVYEILKARCEVFLIGQDIRCLDMDGIDYKSHHCFYWENDRVVAYLRAFFEDPDRKIIHIGRVLAVEQGKGLGTLLMRRFLRDIRKNSTAEKIVLNSQSSATGFYEKFGFKKVGEIFFEAGVEHIKMELEVEK